MLFFVDAQLLENNTEENISWMFMQVLSNNLYDEVNIDNTRIFRKYQILKQKNPSSGRAPNGLFLNKKLLQTISIAFVLETGSLGSHLEDGEGVV